MEALTLEEKRERRRMKQKNQAMDTVVIPLQYPISVQDKEGNKKKVGEITLRRIKAKDMRYIPKELLQNEGRLDNASDLYPVIASVSELPIESIEDLDLTDFVNVSEAFTDFLQESLAIGRS